VLEVADEGVGIPPAERASVFEAFHTGRAPGGHVRGTGIGLSVVHEFVQAHQGVIEFVDGEFKGAHFRIRMPQRVDALPQGMTASRPGMAGPPPRNAHAA
jgi:two-component system sensor histidine kinase GlrK